MVQQIDKAGLQRLIFEIFILAKAQKKMAPQNLGAPGSDFLKDISYEMTVRGVGDNGRPVLVTLRAASHRIHGNT